MMILDAQNSKSKILRRDWNKGADTSYRAISNRSQPATAAETRPPADLCVKPTIVLSPPTIPPPPPPPSASVSVVDPSLLLITHRFYS